MWNNSLRDRPEPCRIRRTMQVYAAIRKLYIFLKLLKVVGEFSTFHRST